MKNDWHYLKDFIIAHKDEAVALATLTKVDGSSYRKAGARLLINAKGNYAGSLSGGCLESGIAKVGMQVIADGIQKTETINTQPHFGCPGVLTIQIEKIQPNQILTDIETHLNQRQSFVLTTNEQGTSIGRQEGFIETVEPSPRLIIVGWTSDQEPLLQMATILGWECVRVVKDNTIANSITPVSNEKIVICSGEELEEKFPADPLSSIVIMSHHMATDFAFLKYALKLKFPYVGLLGSKRRREKLLNELAEHGIMENLDWVDTLHAPVGLDLGAHHPSSIALSILAEIQAVFGGGTAQFLTQKLNQD